MPGGHTPVVLEEVIGLLSPRDDTIYVDGTFGAGGYSRALLDAANCTVLAIDRDPDAVAAGAPMVLVYGGRLIVLHGRFAAMRRLLAARAVEFVQGIVLDIGVSSRQIEDAERGFSFRADGPLDMRMDRTGRSAADLVNELAEDELARLIAVYGEERRAGRIARAIVVARRERAITRTGQLADLVRAIVPTHGRATARLDPATRTFQALRIVVNDEIGELEGGLAAAEALLSPGGIVAVVSFHSLEDRAVKDFLRARSGGVPSLSRHRPAAPGTDREPSFELLTKRPIRPGLTEIHRNPRARSARLRAARRTSAPAWPEVGAHSPGDVG